MYDITVIPTGKLANSKLLFIVIKSQISFDSPLGNNPPIIILKKHPIKRPHKYINPTKSLLKIDDNTKKQTNINGTSLKNKYMVVWALNGMVFDDVVFESILCISLYCIHILLGLSYTYQLVDQFPFFVKLASKCLIGWTRTNLRV